jgi:hypothetical protein
MSACLPSWTLLVLDEGRYSPPYILGLSLASAISAGRGPLLDRFAKAAETGKMLNINDLKKAYEENTGHLTSHRRSTIFCHGV